MIYYKSSDFTIDSLINAKKIRCFVIFSAFGEREADLLCSKISLIKNECNALVDKIIVSHRRIGNNEDKTEIKLKDEFDDVCLLNCNSYSVPDMRDEAGKGADMRRALYFCYKVLKANSHDCIVFLDADVDTELFRSEYFYALAGPIINAEAQFCKASFFRKSGRVKKFTAQPLFSVINHPMLNGLSQFAYPLSGEVAGSFEFFASAGFAQRYGVETALLIDAVMQKIKMADVNLGNYDHIHGSDEDICRMSFGVIRTYLRKLEDYGVISLNENSAISNDFKRTYIDENLEMRSESDSLNEIIYEPLQKIIS